MSGQSTNDYARGFARTVLGISTVELEIPSPAGLISTLVCADLDRASGEWSCSWDATAANGGAEESR